MKLPGLYPSDVQAVGPEWPAAAAAPLYTSKPRLPALSSGYEATFRESGAHENMLRRSDGYHLAIFSMPLPGAFGVCPDS